MPARAARRRPRCGSRSWLESREFRACRPRSRSRGARARARTGRRDRPASAASSPGMITAPSFIAASMVSHSGTTLPSISNDAVAALDARARAARWRRGWSAPTVRRSVSRRGAIADDRSAGRSAAVAPRASSASNQSSAQLNWVGSGQRKSRIGGGVVGAMCEQEVARLLECRPRAICSILSRLLSGQPAEHDREIPCARRRLATAW